MEGLRAVAVLAVVAFHGAIPWAPGGFVGVDIFFVISGFLITGLMLKDVALTGRVHLGDFYARRARRILPLAGVVVMITLLATVALRPPLAVVSVAKDAVATTLYVSNWWFLHQQTDYLGSTSSPSPMLHFWSLSVEEQFYLGWPLAILGVALIFRGRPRRRLVALLVAALGLAAASFALSLWWTATVEPRAYLATPTRVWQFMAGAVLAIASPLVARGAHRAWVLHRTGLAALRWSVGGLGAGAVIWSIHRLDADNNYPGALALIPTLGAVAVILAGGLVPAGHAGGAPSGVSRVLGVAPLRAVGRVSYAWYLWHWPVIVLVPYALGDARHPAELPWQALTALGVASVVPAWVSLRFVEDPLRFARVFRTTRGGLALGAGFVLVPLMAAHWIGSAERAGVAARVEIVTGEQATAAMSVPLADDGAGAQAAFGAVRSRASSVRSGGTSPNPSSAYGDAPDWGECFGSVYVTEPSGCRFGAASASRRVVLFGDSHAAQWLSPIADLASKRGYALEMRTKASCPAAEYSTDSVPLGRLYRECDVWRERVLDQLEADPPDLVVLAAYNASTNPNWVSGWDRSLRRLIATGAPVVYLRPTPIPDFDVPVCISGAFDDWTRCALPRDQVQPDPVATAVAAGAYPGAELLDLTPYFCSSEVCPVVRDHVLVYRDRSHLTDTAARGLEPVLSAALAPYLKPYDGR